MADARIAEAVEREAQVLERGVGLERPRYYPRPLPSRHHTRSAYHHVRWGVMVLSPRPVSTSSHPVSISEMPFEAQALERGVGLERPRYYPRPLSSRPVSTSSHPVGMSSHQRCWSLEITMLRSPIVRTSRQDPITSRQHLSTSRQHAITSEVSVSSDPAISCTHVISSGQRVIMSSQHLAQHHQQVVTSGMVSSDPAITGAPCHHVRSARHQTQSSVK